MHALHVLTVTGHVSNTLQYIIPEIGQLRPHTFLFDDIVGIKKVILFSETERIVLHLRTPA